MTRKELELLSTLIDTELLKRQISNLTIEDMQKLKVDIKKHTTPLKIKRNGDTSVFFVNGLDIRSHADIVEREMKKYGDGGVNFYEDWEYDCICYCYYDDEKANICEHNIDVLVKKLTYQIYKI